MKPYIELGITILNQCDNKWKLVDIRHFSIER